MADIRQNTEVTGKLTVEGGGASTPLEVKGSNDSGVTAYTQFKLTDQSSGTLLELFNQAGTSEFQVSTLGTTIGGSYVLPHNAPSENQILTRATGAAAGVVSWQDLPSQIGGYDVAIGGTPTGGAALLFDGNDQEWYAGTQTIVFPGLDGTTDVGATTDNSITVGGISVRETAITSSETDSVVINSTDSLETNDLLGGLVWTGLNGASAVVDYAKLYTRVADTANSTEDSFLTAKSYRAGTEETALEIHGKEITIAEEYTMPTADGDAGQVIKTDGNGVLSFATAGAGSLDGLTDVDTTGVADGDGIRYDGTDWHAGKWGLGAENQTIDPNLDSASATSRVIKLDTDVDTANSEVFSVTTLDITDGSSNLLERCQITTIDVGMGPTTSIAQEKYGSFYIKKDAGGVANPKLLFNYQYSPGGTTAAFGIKAAPANTYCINLPNTTTGVATGDILSVKSGSTSTEVELELSTLTLDSVTDGGASTTNSITTGTQVVNGSNALIPGLQFNYTGTAADNVPGLVLSADNANLDESLPLISWVGPDAADNVTNYGGITCVVRDKTNGSEDSYFAMGSMKAGAFVKGFKVEGDVVTIGDGLSSTEYELPNDRGTDGYVLTTDGSGSTSWAAGGSGGGNKVYYSKAGKGTLASAQNRWYGDATEGAMEDIQSTHSSAIDPGTINGQVDSYFHNGFVAPFDFTNVRVVGMLANAGDADLYNDDLTLELWRIHSLTSGTDNGSISLMGSTTQTFNGDSGAVFSIDFDCTSNMPEDGDAFFITFTSPDAAAGIAFKFNLTFECT